MKVLSAFIKGCKIRANIYPKLLKTNSVWSPRIAKNITFGEKHFFEKYVKTKIALNADIIPRLTGNQIGIQFIDNIDDISRVLLG